MPQSTPVRTLQDIVDREEISDVVSSYAGAMDRREWDLYLSIFTREIDLDFPAWTGAPRGRLVATEWVDLVRKTLTGFDASHHSIINRIVRILGDSAIVDSHMVAVHSFTSDSDSELERLGGFYTHGLVREKSGWKLNAVKLAVNWDEGDRGLFQRAYERGSRNE